MSPDGIGPGTQVIDENGRALKVPISDIAVSLDPQGINRLSLTMVLVEVDVAGELSWYLGGREVASITYADGTRQVFHGGGVVEGDAVD